MATMGPHQHASLITAATEAYEQAYAPYSHFHVGVALVDEEGRVHSGCNVENAAYPSGTCAEQNAIGAMVTAGGRRIRDLVVITRSETIATPCGACRQRIREFADEHTRIHTYDVQDGFRGSFTLDELLPHAFGPDNLPPHS